MSRWVRRPLGQQRGGTDKMRVFAKIRISPVGTMTVADELLNVQCGQSKELRSCYPGEHVLSVDG